MISLYIFSETSPAAPGTVASSGQVQNAASYLPPGVAGPLDDVDSLLIIAELVGATGGTLDVYIQTSSDGGVTWYDAVHFAQLGAAAGAVIYRAALVRHPPPGVAPIAIGKNLAPALAAANMVYGGFGDRCRLVMVAGSGTSAGAAVKLQISGERNYARTNG